MVLFACLDSCLFLYFRQEKLPDPRGVSGRCNIPHLQCQRQSHRTNSDDSFQSAIRHHFFYLFLLRRNDHLSRHDHANGVFSLIAWLRHPYKDCRSQVQVNSVSKRELLILLGITAIVTTAFYLLLLQIQTANLVPSTISVATSFLAVYLTFRRSPYFALAYAANDGILIWLWVLAGITNVRYLSVVVCFVTFLINDIYGFISWQRIKIKQAKNI